MKKFFKRHWLLASLLVSLFLHGVLFPSSGLIYFYFRDHLRAPGAGEETLRKQVKPHRPRPPLEFTFVETPDRVKPARQADKPKYISDKSAAAQDQAQDKSLPVDNPFSDGLVDFAQRAERPGGKLSSPAETDRENTKTQESRQEQSTESLLFRRKKPNTSFNREFITGGKRQKKAQTGFQGELEREAMRNLASRAVNSGAFSLNTYDWDFAPYLLKLKRTIERKNIPPAAFRKLGLIDGKTSLVFRIMPDGRLEGLKVLETIGSSSLVTTAVNAVRASAPFAPLPEDFPEDYLEVRFRFEYLINHR